ncbi:DUF211 domain-containing protein [Infirmifilum sp. NZ]|uniref:DUF211 domain-containing protein n=1 Tax=Infirmifilum sp. NZ TaxID=2926850 RepID=UPI000CB09759|nr:DUF211 domain-containing protein [Infirmifilum sp. NZ]PLJ77700.1 MAG: hypothetical protein B7L53_04950 [Thermofilum sp. NZ13]UNQ72561.1 DUF211 domain-containing protein [Infirmifilum sp. NZ]
MSKEPSITRMLIDALKPRDVTVVDIARSLISLEKVSRVEINVAEVDVKTETLKISISGTGIDIKEIERTLEKHATVIRSIDYVVAEK